MGTRQDDSTTLSEGGEEGDDGRRRRVIPGNEFEQMVRNGQQRKTPLGAHRAPLTVANLFAGDRPAPAFHEVTAAWNNKDRPESVGVKSLPREDYKAIEERLSQQRTTRRRWTRVLGVVAVALIGGLLLWLGAVSAVISWYVR